MAVITRATLEPVLKELYPSGLPTQLYYNDFTLYGLLGKKGDLGGKLTSIPMTVSAGFGRSKAFGTAKANQKADVYRNWQIQSSKDYAYGTITRKAMKEAQNDRQGFIRSTTELINNRIYSLTQSIAVDLYRGGSLGGYASVASISAANGAVVTLQNAADIANFEVSMTVEIRPAAGGSARTLGTAATAGEITAVDRTAGTFTLGGVDNSGDVDTVVAGDSIWVEGDYALQTASSSTATSDVPFMGLQSWIPATVASNDSFFGVNRSVDRVRLAGIYQDQSSGTIEEALVNTGRLVKRESGKTPDLVLMNDDKAAQLVLELGSKVERTERKVGEFSFETMKVNLNGGQAEILTDRNCPVNEAFMIKPDTWGIHHAPGELIELVDEDGNMLFREADADGFEIRAAAYHQLVCYEPACNARIVLPS